MDSKDIIIKENNSSLWARKNKSKNNREKNMMIREKKVLKK